MSCLLRARHHVKAELAEARHAGRLALWRTLIGVIHDLHAAELLAVGLRVRRRQPAGQQRTVRVVARRERHQRRQRVRCHLHTCIRPVRNPSSPRYLLTQSCRGSKGSSRRVPRSCNHGGGADWRLVQLLMAVWRAAPIQIVSCGACCTAWPRRCVLTVARVPSVAEAASK